MGQQVNHNQLKGELIYSLRDKNMLCVYVHVQYKRPFNKGIKDVMRSQTKDTSGLCRQCSATEPQPCTIKETIIKVSHTIPMSVT